MSGSAEGRCHRGYSCQCVVDTHLFQLFESLEVRVALGRLLRQPFLQLGALLQVSTNKHSTMESRNEFHACCTHSVLELDDHNHTEIEGHTTYV